MITALSFAILVSASAATMDAETNRVSYNNCLVDFVTTHLDQKTALGGFRKVAKEACIAERDALVAAIKKDELEFGSTNQEATDYAQEEAGNVLFSYIDSYNSYLNSDTRPVKE
ncbi:MAG: hypothetical protein Pars2KO_30510 [Parasphingorhabdus sp.]